MMSRSTSPGGPGGSLPREGGGFRAPNVICLEKARKLKAEGPHLDVPGRRMIQRPPPARSSSRP